MTRTPRRTISSLVVLGIAALAAAPAHAGEDERQPPDIKLERPYIFEGTLWLSDIYFQPPSTTTPRKACHGRVRLTARAKGELVASDSVRLPRACNFSHTMSVGSARRVRLTISFSGNDEMARTKETFTVKRGRPRFDPNVG